LKIEHLKRILNGDIDHINVRDIALYEDNVLIQPRHVRKMLIDFLQGKISSEDLTKWAEFICLRGEYVSVPTNIPPTSRKFDEIADYYEDMMYVIQRLSTPQIDGEVTEERVKQYLLELDQYKKDYSIS